VKRIASDILVLECPGERYSLSEISAALEYSRRELACIIYDCKRHRVPYPSMLEGVHLREPQAYVNS